MVLVDWEGRWVGRRRRLEIGGRRRTKGRMRRGWRGCSRIPEDSWVSEI